MKSPAMADWPHEVHPNRRDHSDAIGLAIDALSDAQRWELLHWLSGYAPAAVERALQARLDWRSVT